MTWYAMGLRVCAPGTARGAEAGAVFAADAALAPALPQPNSLPAPSATAAVREGLAEVERRGAHRAADLERAREPVLAHAVVEVLALDRVDAVDELVRRAAPVEAALVLEDVAQRRVDGEVVAQPLDRLALGVRRDDARRLERRRRLGGSMGSGDVPVARLSKSP